MFISLTFSLSKHFNLLCKLIMLVFFEQLSRFFNALSQFPFYRICFNLHIININLEISAENNQNNK